MSSKLGLTLCPHAPPPRKNLTSPARPRFEPHHTAKFSNMRQKYLGVIGRLIAVAQCRSHLPNTSSGKLQQFHSIGTATDRSNQLFGGRANAKPMLT